MDANIPINWLNNNEMVANAKKLQLMFLARNKCIEKEMPFVEKAIESSSTITLHYVTILLHYITLCYITLQLHYIRQKFKFKSHIENICCKANNKIKALFRIRIFLHSNKQRF